MPTRPQRGAAPDYTTAFLATFGVILFMALLTLAALAGTLAMLAAALGVDLSIRGLGHRLRRGS